VTWAVGQEGRFMIRVKADVEKCEGHANCTLSAPDLFDLDENDRVIVLQPVISDSQRARAHEAILSCPVAAIWLEDERD
jgi:ferredoxin